MYLITQTDLNFDDLLHQQGLLAAQDSPLRHSSPQLPDSMWYRDHQKSPEIESNEHPRLTFAFAQR